MSENRWMSDLHWTRPGQQDRSQKTQSALLDAAETLFFEKGVENTSVADVAAKAGCSVGALYHHFRDKKALLYALYDRMTQEYQEISRNAVDSARWQGASIVDMLRGFLTFGLQLAKERPGFKHAGLAAANMDPELREHFAELRLESNRRLNKLLLSRKDEVGHPDPIFAIAFVIDQISAMLRSRNDDLLRRTQLATCTEDEFIEEALQLACGYLEIELT